MATKHKKGTPLGDWHANYGSKCHHHGIRYCGSCWDPFMSECRPPEPPRTPPVEVT